MRLTRPQHVSVLLVILLSVLTTRLAMADDYDYEQGEWNGDAKKSASDNINIKDWLKSLDTRSTEGDEDLAAALPDGLYEALTTRSPAAFQPIKELLKGALTGLIQTVVGNIKNQMGGEDVNQDRTLFSEFAEFMRNIQSSDSDVAADQAQRETDRSNDGAANSDSNMLKELVEMFIGKRSSVAEEEQAQRKEKKEEAEEEEEEKEEEGKDLFDMLLNSAGEILQEAMHDALTAEPGAMPDLEKMVKKAQDSAFGMAKQMGLSPVRRGAQSSEEYDVEEASEQLRNSDGQSEEEQLAGDQRQVRREPAVSLMTDTEAQLAAYDADDDEENNFNEYVVRSSYAPSKPLAGNLKQKSARDHGRESSALKRRPRPPTAVLRSRTLQDTRGLSKPAAAPKPAGKKMEMSFLRTTLYGKRDETQDMANGYDTADDITAIADKYDGSSQSDGEVADIADDGLSDASMVMGDAGLLEEDSLDQEAVDQRSPGFIKSIVKSATEPAGKSAGKATGKLADKLIEKALENIFSRKRSADEREDSAAQQQVSDYEEHVPNNDAIDNARLGDLGLRANTDGVSDEEYDERSPGFIKAFTKAAKKSKKKASKKKINEMMLKAQIKAAAKAGARPAPIPGMMPYPYSWPHPRSAAADTSRFNAMRELPIPQLPHIATHFAVRQAPPTMLDAILALAKKTMNTTIDYWGRQLAPSSMPDIFPAIKALFSGMLDDILVSRRGVESPLHVQEIAQLASTPAVNKFVDHLMSQLPSYLRKRRSTRDVAKHIKLILQSSLRNHFSQQDAARIRPVVQFYRSDSSQAAIIRRSPLPFSLIKMFLPKIFDAISEMDGVKNNPLIKSLLPAAKDLVDKLLSNRLTRRDATIPLSMLKMLLPNVLDTVAKMDFVKNNPFVKSLLPMAKDLLNKMLSNRLTRRDAIVPLSMLKMLLPKILDTVAEMDVVKNNPFMSSLLPMAKELLNSVLSVGLSGRSADEWTFDERSPILPGADALQLLSPAFLKTIVPKIIDFIVNLPMVKNNPFIGPFVPFIKSIVMKAIPFDRMSLREPQELVEELSTMVSDGIQSLNERSPPVLLLPLSAKYKLAGARRELNLTSRYLLGVLRSVPGIRDNVFLRRFVDVMERTIGDSIYTNATAPPTPSSSGKTPLFPSITSKRRLSTVARSNATTANTSYSGGFLGRHRGNKVRRVLRRGHRYDVRSPGLSFVHKKLLKVCCKEKFMREVGNCSKIQRRDALKEPTPNLVPHLNHLARIVQDVLRLLSNAHGEGRLWFMAKKKEMCCNPNLGAVMTRCGARLR